MTKLPNNRQEKCDVIKIEICGIKDWLAYSERTSYHKSFCLHADRQKNIVAWLWYEMKDYADH